MKRQVCLNCKSKPRMKHFNAKYCVNCSEASRRGRTIGSGKLSPSQERTVRKFANKIYIHELAAKVGVSKSTLVRWARRNKVSLNALKYPDHVVKEVCEFYSLHGKTKTQKKFPKVRIRSIIERYFSLPPRQTRWTGEQLIHLTKMAGLISFADQAKYFNRPNANAGSIKSAWMKKFRTSGASVNGLSRWIARPYVTKACPYYDTSYWMTDHRRTKQNRVIALWIDVAACLRDDVPDHLKQAIKAMASFQRWLHGDDPRKSILRILEGNL